MILIAAGEEFKKIDRQTRGKLFARYPQVEWRGAIGDFANLPLLCGCLLRPAWFRGTFLCHTGRLEHVL